MAATLQRGFSYKMRVRPRAPGVTQSSRGHRARCRWQPRRPLRRGRSACCSGAPAPPGARQRDWVLRLAVQLRAATFGLQVPLTAFTPSLPASVASARQTAGSLLAWPTLARRHPSAPSGRSLTSAGCHEYLRHVTAGKVSWGRRGGWRALRAEHRAQEDCGVLPGRGKPGAGRGRAEPGAGGAPRSRARRPGERSLRLFVPQSVPRDLGVPVPARLQGCPEVTATGTCVSSAPDGSSPGLPAGVCL